MSLKLVTAAAALPVTLTELKAHLRIDSTDFDTELTLALNAAINDVEEELWRALISQQWRLSLDQFPTWAIALPKGNLITVDEISYLDSEGVRTVMSASDYTVSTQSEPGLVFPDYGTTWPTARTEPESIKIKFTCGYGAAASSVPAAIKQAILLKAGWLFDGVETDIALGGTDTIRARTMGGLLHKFQLRDERIAEVAA